MNAQGSNSWKITLLALQAFQVIFLWIHDWVPLGRLNDVAEVRRADTPTRLVTVTLIQSVPFTIGLVFSAFYLKQQYPMWLDEWLWISYGLLLIGQLRAWWVPYLFKSDPERVERYQKMFGNTIHSCRNITGSPRIPRIFCCIWLPRPLWRHCF